MKFFLVGETRPGYTGLRCIIKAKNAFEAREKFLKRNPQRLIWPVRVEEISKKEFEEKRA